MKLRPEYQAIEDELIKYYYLPGKAELGAAVCAIQKCQDLADRPPKMLTDDEINEIKRSAPWSIMGYADAIQKAFIAKQREPDTVPFDYALWSMGGWLAIAANGVIVDCLLPNNHYTMRKIV